MMGWYGLNGAAPFMWIGMGLFWIVLIGLVVFLVARLLPGSGSSGQPPAGSGPSGAAKPPSRSSTACSPLARSMSRPTAPDVAR